MHTAPPFCKEKKSLEPNHSVCFSQDPAFYSYKMVAPTPWGRILKGDLECIGLRDPTFICKMYIPFLTGHYT